MTYNVGQSNVTIGQILVLVFYGAGTLIFGIYSTRLFKKIRDSKNTTPLSAQGDGTLA